MFTDKLNQLADKGIFSVRVPGGFVDDEGMALVREHISEEFSIRFPDDFSPDWVVTKGKYAGTFPKRVSAYLWKERGIRATPEQVSEIGNIASAHASREQTVYLDIKRPPFDWESGDFGDTDSCFWMGRSAARHLLEHKGAFAMRRFNSEHKGIGRCWVVPDAIGDTAIVFNAYPKGYQLINYARILALLTDNTYKNIRLLNEEDWDGHLYINGGKGILVGAYALISETEEFDFGWEEERMGECECCGRSVLENEMTTFDAGTWHATRICAACSAKQRHCDHCGGNYVLPGHSPQYYNANTRQNEVVCWSCVQLVSRCPHCWNMFFAAEDECVCPGCNRDVRSNSAASKPAPRGIRFTFRGLDDVIHAGHEGIERAAQTAARAREAAIAANYLGAVIEEPRVAPPIRGYTGMLSDNGQQGARTVEVPHAFDDDQEYVFVDPPTLDEEGHLRWVIIPPDNDEQEAQ